MTTYQLEWSLAIQRMNLQFAIKANNKKRSSRIAGNIARLKALSYCAMYGASLLTQKRVLANHVDYAQLEQRAIAATLSDNLRVLNPKAVVKVHL